MTVKSYLLVALRCHLSEQRGEETGVLEQNSPHDSQVGRHHHWISLHTHIQHIPLPGEYTITHAAKVIWHGKQKGNRCSVTAESIYQMPLSVYVSVLVLMVKLTSPSTIPLKTAGSRGWNMWAPRMGLTFKAISTTCQHTKGEKIKGIIQSSS